MRRTVIAALIAGTLLQGCSLGPILPEGCDKLAMTEMRRQACESSWVPGWAKHPQAAGATEPEQQCRRTIGGVECYAPR